MDSIPWWYCEASEGTAYTQSHIDLLSIYTIKIPFEMSIFYSTGMGWIYFPCHTVFILSITSNIALNTIPFQFRMALLYVYCVCLLFASVHMRMCISMRLFAVQIHFHFHLTTDSRLTLFI